MRFDATRLGVGSGAGLLGAILATMLTQGTAQAQIAAVVQESGRITLSVDAVGTNTGATTIQVNKPVGATVRGAYLAAASYNNYVIPDGDIVLNGNAISWDSTFSNFGGFFYSVFADVTSDVAATINGAGPGIVNIPVDEGLNTFSIDGEILAVIFDDLVNVPATENNGIILLFGGQALTGDTFFINLAEPLDLSSSSVKADLSLGISFGYQDDAPTGQWSQVDVNGTRMTTAAGGEDDGNTVFGENGALITVGGFNDSNANPANPNAVATNWADDDELYSLLPYYVPSSTLITVDTLNPSNDDNIFFGAVCTSVPAITQGIQLTPVNATNPLGATHTVTATVIDSQNNPVPGVLVSFQVVAGPNTGANGTDTTNALGQATFSYPGFTVGRDTIVATFVDSQGVTQTSNTCNKIWQEQCLLALGSGPGASNFTPADHTFVVQLADVEHWEPVLLSDFGQVTVQLPEQSAPHQGTPFTGGIRRAHDPVSAIVEQFAAQVVMWNPEGMPQQPEMYTPGLLVWVLANGDLVARPYGRSGGMEISATREYFPGGPGSPRRVVVHFPFTIPGF